MILAVTFDDCRMRSAAIIDCDQARYLRLESQRDKPWGCPGPKLLDRNRYLIGSIGVSTYLLAFSLETLFNEQACTFRDRIVGCKGDISHRFTKSIPLATNHAVPFRSREFVDITID